ncbi:hypothetical protein HDU91_001156 [Kappamyces sp. JEL0680]|nr:hypothetical protein HDU91_001156 [Kappamyces sp. JEL0680]
MGNCCSSTTEPQTDIKVAPVAATEPPVIVQPVVDTPADDWPDNSGSHRVLYLIVPFANPCSFKRRTELLIQTVARLKDLSKSMNGRDRIEVVVAQLVYEGQKQLHFNHNDLVWNTHSGNVLWSKENLINLAVRTLVATHRDCRYFGWVDADITFEHSNMFTQTLDILEETPMALVQLFSHAHFEGDCYTVKSFAYQYSLLQAAGYQSHSNRNPEYWHPGFAWAISRDAFLAVGGLIDRTLGSADRHMAMALLGRVLESMPSELADQEYGRVATEWQAAAQRAGMQLRHVNGTVTHSWHGDMKNRKYVERWDILKKFKFEPSRHVQKNEHGLIVWHLDTDPLFLQAVLDYFRERNEDDPSPGNSHADLGQPHEGTSDANTVAAIIAGIGQSTTDAANGAAHHQPEPAPAIIFPGMYAGAA